MNDEEKKRVGKRIKRIRKNNGYTLKEFGIVLGKKLKKTPITESIISRWERGVSLPNNERLEAIANLSGVSVRYLLSGMKSWDELSEKEIKHILISTNLCESLKLPLLEEILSTDFEGLNFLALDAIANIINLIESYGEPHSEVIDRLALAVRQLNQAYDISTDETMDKLAQEKGINETINETKKIISEDYFETIRKKLLGHIKVNS